jgi:recombination protein RecA
MATVEKAESQSASKAEVAKVAPVAAAPPARAAAPRDPQRDRAIELAVSTIEKQFGKGSIMRLGEETAPPEVRVVPTGSLGLDIALGVGGLPRGRVVEIYGPESSGKTTLALHVVGQAQRAGGICAFVDAEHALDVGYARKLGVRTDDLLVSQPDFGEQALEITEMLVRSGAIDVIVVDSVAALTPRAELEGEMGDAHVGLQARLMSQALRKLTGTISKSHTLVIFINQIRMKIGVMFGNPETTTGGNALKFYSSVRLDIRRVGALKDGDKVVGNRTRVKVVKNKLAPPFREVEFDIMYGEGISHEGDLVDLGAEAGVVEKSGAWFGFEGDRIGQGRDNAKQYLRDHPEVSRKIESKVLVHHGVRREVGPPALAAGAVNGSATPQVFAPTPKPGTEKKGR